MSFDIYKPQVKQKGKNKMKNRRFALIAFMLAAVLTMSIGFAAYSTDLLITGQTRVDANALNFTNQVVFTEASTSNATYGTADIAEDGQSATFDVFGMTQEGQYVDLTYTIKNNSSYDVTNIEVTTRPTHVGDTKCVVSTVLSAHEIPAGGSITATVTVQLKETVTQATTTPITWSIVYTATSANAPAQQ